MSKIIDEIKHGVDVTIPEKEDLAQMAHPKADYIMLIFRNIFAFCAMVLFVVSFFLSSSFNYIKAIAYLCGAVAYIFELLALTDCFRTRVGHHEMFMVYCFGPLYLLMGLGYIFK